jgi:hypothetical protein
LERLVDIFHCTVDRDVRGGGNICSHTRAKGCAMRKASPQRKSAMHFQMRLLCGADRRSYETAACVSDDHWTFMKQFFTAETRRRRDSFVSSTNILSCLCVSASRRWNPLNL